MKEFKGAPGPWKYESSSDVRWDGEDESFWDYFTICDEEGDEVARCEDVHDANLIAAAPELLKELQRLRNYVTDVCGVNDEDCHPEHPLMSSKAAIAKALGETK